MRSECSLDRRLLEACDHEYAVGVLRSQCPAIKDERRLLAVVDATDEREECRALRKTRPVRPAAQRLRPLDQQGRRGVAPSAERPFPHPPALACQRILEQQNTHRRCRCEQAQGDDLGDTGKPVSWRRPLRWAHGDDRRSSRELSGDERECDRVQNSVDLRQHDQSAASPLAAKERRQVARFETLWSDDCDHEIMYVAEMDTPFVALHRCGLGDDSEVDATDCGGIDYCPHVRQSVSRVAPLDEGDRR